MSSIRSRRGRRRRARLPRHQRGISVAEMEVAGRRRREAGHRRQIARLRQREEIGTLQHAKGRAAVTRACAGSGSANMIAGAALGKGAGDINPRFRNPPMTLLSGPRLASSRPGPARQLVVLLHGVGADGEDLIGLAPALGRTPAARRLRRARRAGAVRSGALRPAVVLAARPPPGRPAGGCPGERAAAGCVSRRRACPPRARQPSACAARLLARHDDGAACRAAAGAAGRRQCWASPAR